MNFTPAIPDPGIEMLEDIKRILDPVKETIDVREGRKLQIPNEKAVTLQNLMDLDLITQTDINEKLK